MVIAAAVVAVVLYRIILLWLLCDPTIFLMVCLVLEILLENERENPGVTVIEKKDYTTPILILLAGVLLVANYINTPVSGKLGKRKSRRRRNKKKKGTKRRRSRKN